MAMSSAARPPSKREPAAAPIGDSRALDLPDELMLIDGTTVSFRPIEAADSDALAAMFSRLTPESKHRRFLSAKPGLSAKELSYFTEVDHIAHEAIVAIDHADGSIVGEARYAGFTIPTGAADFAVVVADRLQHMRLGTALANHTVDRARRNGVSRLTATTVWENAPARALLWRLGFRARGSAGHEIELELLLTRQHLRDHGPLGQAASPWVTSGWL
jgi:RimJ/RimL family protein N-acetyltransferase